jgi:hypothetical protein
MLDQIISRLQAREPLPPLFPKQVWDDALSREIQNAPDLTDGVRAGLLLWNDDLDASHTISQGIETPTGSFWHAIMHRREGDAGNSLYWWRRTSAHPAFVEVGKAALKVLEDEEEKTAQVFADSLRRAGTWRPDEFVDYCQRAGHGDDSWQRRVQVAEMEALLRWCREHGE